MLKIKAEVEEKRKKDIEEEERHIQIGAQKHAVKKPLEEIMQYMDKMNQKHFAKKQRLLDESQQSLNESMKSNTTSVSMQSVI